MKLKMLVMDLALCGAVSMMKVCAEEAKEAAPQEQVAAAEEAAPEAGKEVTTLQQWVTYLKQGGTTMIFIGLLSMLGIGCAIERFCNLRRSRVVPDGFSAEVIGLWKKGRYDEVSDLCVASNSMLARVVETMLQHRDSKDYQEVKLFAEDKVGRELRLDALPLHLRPHQEPSRPVCGPDGGRGRRSRQPALRAEVRFSHGRQV